MKTVYSKIILLPLIFFTPLVALTSNSLIFIWMMMEISTMSFIFLMAMSNITINKWEVAMSYFFIQSLSSSLLIPLLFFSNLNLPKMILLINIILSFKMGLSPFHSWIPWLMNNMSWMNCFILTTFQKIVPLVLLNYFSKMNFLIIMSLLTVSISSIMMLKSSPLKKIMAYSSISNTGWMVFILNSSSSMMLYYLLIYSINTYILFKLFNVLNIYIMTDFNKLSFTNWSMKASIIFSLLSLAGLPPFTGFMMKLFAISSFKNYSMILMLMILFSLINLFKYINMCWSMFFFIETSSKLWMNSNKNSKFKSLIFPFLFLTFWTLLIIMFMK